MRRRLRYLKIYIYAEQKRKYTKHTYALLKVNGHVFTQDH